MYYEKIMGIEWSKYDLEKALAMKDLQVSLNIRLWHWIDYTNCFDLDLRTQFCCERYERQVVSTFHKQT